jgi:hypothetical protein
MRVEVISAFMGANGEHKPGEVYEEHPVTAVHLVATNKVRALVDSKRIMPWDLNNLEARLAQLQKQAAYAKRKAARAQHAADEAAKELKKKQAEYAKQPSEPEKMIARDLFYELEEYANRNTPVKAVFINRC